MRRPLQSPALVSAFYDSVRPEQRETGLIVQNAVLAAAPSLRVEVKWGNLVFTQDGFNLMALVLFNVNAHLQVFNGASLTNQFPELQGAGKGMRHVKFRYRQPVDEGLIQDIAAASLHLLGRMQRADAGRERIRRPEPTMSDDAFEPHSSRLAER